MPQGRAGFFCYKLGNNHQEDFSGIEMVRKDQPASVALEQSFVQEE